MPRLPLACCLLVACGPDPWEGDRLPTPGSVRLQLAADDGVVVDSALVVLDELHIDRCDGPDGLTMVRSLVSLETTAAYLTDGGWWCGLEATFDGPIALSAEQADGSGTLVAELDLPSVTLPIRPDFFVDSHPFLLQLGAEQWLSDADLGLAPGTEVAVIPGDAAHDRLVASLAESSALWIDVGGDGLLGTDEQDSGPVATGPTRSR